MSGGSFGPLFAGIRWLRSLLQTQEALEAALDKLPHRLYAKLARHWPVWAVGAAGAALWALRQAAACFKNRRKKEAAGT